jgi:cytochrome c biogenesis protein CcdA
LALFGLARIWPGPYDRLIARIGGPLQRLSAAGGTGSGNAGGFVLGLSLGAVWTPCAGPVLASIIALVVQARDPGRSVLLVVLYALGAALPMLALIHGGRHAAQRVRSLARHLPTLQRAFGVLVLASAAAIYFQYDILFYGWLSSALPTLKGL